MLFSLPSNLPTYWVKKSTYKIIQPGLNPKTREHESYRTNLYYDRSQHIPGLFQNFDCKECLGVQN
jgi:hypothetical protein